MGLPQARQVDGIKKPLTLIIGTLFSLFYIYTSVFGLFSSVSHRAMYLLFTLVLIFIFYPASQKRFSESITKMDWLLVAMSIFCNLYWIYDYPARAARFGEPNTMIVIIGAMLVFLSLEAARRVLGWSLVVLAVFALLYCFLGPWVPNAYFAHKAFSFTSVMNIMASEVAIYGVVVNAYATYVFLFIIFAAFLESAGGGLFLIQMANAIAGRSKGGPAKVAVISSGLVGSLLGASVANVVITGSFTIPMMKRTGYKPHVAGAIEAAASTGGQFMPPVMGAGAFLIAEILGISYSRIIAVAAIPAIIYFLSVLFYVHFEACKQGILPVDKDEVPRLREILKDSGSLLIPALLILYMLIRGYSANLAATTAIGSMFLLSFLKKDTRITPRKLVEILALAAKNSLIVGATAGVVGIVIGCLVLSGAGLKFSALLIMASSKSLLLTFVLVSVVCYIMGMGMTVVAAYVIVAVIAGPAMVTLGVPALAAHLMVFYLVNSSGITPPVALVAFAASGIAHSNPSKTGYTALKFALALWILPFLFVYSSILDISHLWNVIFLAVFLLIGFYALAASFQGYLNKPASWLQRLALLASAVLCFVPSFKLSFVGVALLALTYMWQKAQKGGYATA